MREADSGIGNLSRRSFLAGSGAMGTALLGGALGLAGCTPREETTSRAGQGDEQAMAVTGGERAELDYPGEEEAPEKTAYTCDVLVIGSGWAGTHAAVRAARAGQSVICMDKGYPGYSGLTPFSNNTTWYDPDWDSLDGTLKYAQKTGEYVTNLNYLETFLLNSRSAFDLNTELGLVEQYNTAHADGFDDDESYLEYYKQYRDDDRHARWAAALTDNGVEILPWTMATHLTTSDGRVTGAIGFQFRSSTVVSVSAKAVVLCTNSGSVKPTGYPTCGNTFDGEYMAYQLGLPLIGKEFDDFHASSSFAPGDSFYVNVWEYVQCLQPKCSFNQGETDEAIAESLEKNARFMMTKRIGSVVNGLAPNSGDQKKGSHGTTPNPDDPKIADYSSNQQEYKEERLADLYGAAAGMTGHMCGGVFCGWDDVEGKTGYPGLYVAGDGIYGCMLEGAVYSLASSTSSGCSTEGDLAGAAAAEYASSVELIEVSAEEIAAASEEIFEPSTLEAGFDPNWVRDQLQAVMVAPQVHIARNEATLTAALCQVEWLRDNALPKLMGYTGHDLRLCLEARHKVLACELKLRAQLYRKESRGLHYRTDYPYRDDENFLCHVTVRKGDDGMPVLEKVDVPEEWKGDVGQDYAKRYLFRFPGEQEAKGLPAEA